MSSNEKLELFYWPTPNGWKVSVLLEELQIPYKLTYVDISKGDQFASEFLAIGPNNRIPVLVDQEGPDGEPISIFESGAIMQYLGRKFDKFYPNDERGRVEVDQWLMWQMGGLGPMAGQTHHFRVYAPEKVPYAIERYTNEVNRLYGVMEKRLLDRDFLANEYSIADMACIGWASLWERQGQEIEQFPNLEAWIKRVTARPAVERGLALGRDIREKTQAKMKDQESQSILFGQKAK